MQHSLCLHRDPCITVRGRQLEPGLFVYSIFHLSPFITAQFQSEQEQSFSHLADFQKVSLPHQ
jgi:hypothetical protein